MSIPRTADMLIERNRNGSITISVIFDNRRIAMTYYEYSKRDAIREFRRHLKTLSHP